MGCEGVEDLAREAVGVEDGFEVAVAFDEARGGGLEVGFGEFGFEEEIAELEIDFGAVRQGLICECVGWWRWRVENPDLRIEIWGTRIFAGSCVASCAAFADGFQGDAGSGAEAGLGGAVDVEQVGDGWGEGAAVEDSGMAEDVHEEGVGADGGVEFAPGPVVTGGRAAGGGVGLGEATEPGGVGGDGAVG